MPPLVFPCRRVLEGWINATTSSTCDPPIGGHGVRPPEGLDWRRVHAARETPTPMQPG
jgi:hypothetical protein